MKNQTRRVPGSRGAFTLIELLVVIAIIAVLCAIILPVTSRVQQSARQAQSISNLRQIAAAANLYANDNANALPMGYYYTGLPGTHEITYMAQLATYVGGTSTMLFVSPTSALLPVKASTNTSTALTSSLNNLVCPDTSKGNSQVLRTSIPHPDQVILVADGCQMPSSTNYSRCTFTYPTLSTGGTSSLDQPIAVTQDSDTAAAAGWMRYRSNGGVGVAMVDGHAEVIKKGSVLNRNLLPNW